MELSTIQQDETSTRAIAPSEQRAERGWIQATITWCLERVSMTDVTIRVERNGRFSARMGDARVLLADYANRSGRVRFSAHALWRRASAVKRRNTVVHEVAHVLAELVAGPTQRVSHGTGWKRMMVRLGESPTRCHSVNRNGLRRRSARRPQTVKILHQFRARVVTVPVARPSVSPVGVSVKFRSRGVNGRGIVLSSAGGFTRLKVVGDHGRTFFGSYVLIPSHDVS